MSFLKIKNLSVSSEGKQILKNIDLKLEKGRIYALFGKNGSGKSTLANAIIGNPKYLVKGEIVFNGKNLLGLTPDKRAREGIFMSFQNPTEVPGVNIFNFLRNSYNLVNKNKLSIFEFKKLIDSRLAELGLNKEFLDRNLNENFSGGEKKKLESLQLLLLNPKLIILDEIDSGLDKNSSEKILELIDKIKNQNNTFLVISHYENFIESIKPDKVFEIDNGKIN